MYKGAALCYRDCNNIGLVNCGIGMCAEDKQTCGQGIAKMTTEFLTGLAQSVGFVLSFGASSGATTGAKAAAKTGLKTLIKKGGKAIQRGLKLVKNIAKNPNARKSIINKMWQKAKTALKNKIKGEIESQLQKTCELVANKLLDNAKDSHTDPQNFNVDKLDVIGVGDIKQSCSNTSTSNDRLACAKSVMETLGNADPTGLMAMATAFMQPVCDV